ncbi:hypothetical protein I2494_06050 [Budviciaceae bacterium BWR-B9]|uniref:Uncharacterized protein n=1 Tax=Limnobaculum allomyrinae TaxID=2791986 RepID=A0ABS1IP15_9GAMM|nr:MULTISPECIES: hypothetical protein [Limnobaculum]MBK5143281.1 hypothetical protein [Limnobaculum allomyrinae]MBV7691169.1 hypothetical protein [Limnobaculum sp. M2-1]
MGESNNIFLEIRAISIIAAIAKRYFCFFARIAVTLRFLVGISSCLRSSTRYDSSATISVPV